LNEYKLACHLLGLFDANECDNPIDSGLVLVLSGEETSRLLDRSGKGLISEKEINK
jgi:hypothetical protein